jgi:hypothetical protein
MIGLRDRIHGFYKGQIYCSSIEKANKISECLDIAANKNLGSGLSSQGKRGCSEHLISFLEYK